MQAGAWSAKAQVDSGAYSIELIKVDTI